MWRKNYKYYVQRLHPQIFQKYKENILQICLHLHPDDEMSAGADWQKVLNFNQAKKYSKVFSIQIFYRFVFILIPMMRCLRQVWQTPPHQFAISAEHKLTKMFFKYFFQFAQIDQKYFFYGSILQICLHKLNKGFFRCKYFNDLFAQIVQKANNVSKKTSIQI